MLSVETAKIGFIGFGNMASAMADGWITWRRECPRATCMRAPAASTRCRLAARRAACALETARELVEAVDVVVVAIKPYLIEEVLSPLADVLADRAVLSVAAGWNCSATARCSEGVGTLSTIPNTPVSINEGVIACDRATTLDEDGAALVRGLLGLLGSVVEVESRLLSVAGTVGGCSGLHRHGDRGPGRCRRQARHPASHGVHRW